MHRFKATMTALAAAACLLPALAQAAPAQRDRERDRERVIVAFKAGSGVLARAEALRQGGRVNLDLDDANAFAVTLPRAAIARLARHPAVEFVEPDAVRTIQRVPGKRSIAAVAAAGQSVPYGIVQTQSDQITGAPRWTPKVCVIDSGIDGTHPDLAGNTLSGRNYTGVGDWNTDENAHGTHVAGTIAALDNGIGVVGVNGKKQVSLIIAKVFDASGSAASSTITKAIRDCGRAGANVISMSLGGSRGTRTEQRVVDRLAAQGVLLVAAAGNDGTADISFPAGFASVMSVAANDEARAWADFSQFNADVEISAPGVAVQSTIPPNIESRATLSVAGASYPVLALAGSPRLAATGALADFGLGTAAVAGSMAGKVCLISRGEIAFADKVLNCQNSGGVGAVIYNNTAGDLLATVGETVTTIPSASTTQADGATLLTKLGQSATVTVEPDPSLYAAFDGTSMATPHVSGIAALVWSYFPNCSAEQVRTALKTTALDAGEPGRDDQFGAGIVQAKAAKDFLATQACAR